MSPDEWRRRALALAAALLLAGCTSDRPESADPDRTTGPTAPGTTEPSGPTVPPDPPTSDETVTTPGPTTPAPTTTTEPPVATGSEPARREAPPARAGVLVFDRIVVLPGDDGSFSGRANVRNDGDGYLNGVTVRWRILGPGGVELDRGVARRSSIAPGETTTIELDGSRRYSDDWVRVSFASG